MIPQEWIDKYCLKSGDDRLVETKYSHQCEEGFATWNIAEDTIIVVQCYGDGTFWQSFFKEMSEQTKLKVQFVTRRNPKAVARKFGCKVIAYVMEF